MFKGTSQTTRLRQATHHSSARHSQRTLLHVCVFGTISAAFMVTALSGSATPSQAQSPTYGASVSAQTTTFDNTKFIWGSPPPPMYPYFLINGRPASGPMGILPSTWVGSGATLLIAGNYTGYLRPLTSTVEPVRVTSTYTVTGPTNVLSATVQVTLQARFMFNDNVGAYTTALVQGRWQWDDLLDAQGIPVNFTNDAYVSTGPSSFNNAPAQVFTKVYTVTLTNGVGSFVTHYSADGLAETFVGQGGSNVTGIATFTVVSVTGS